MKEVCFIVNVDWFFDSHRKPLTQMLSKNFNISIIAGNTGFISEVVIKTFEVRSRLPTIGGVVQLYREVKKLNKNTIFIIVSPVMIFFCHFILRRHKRVVYNFSGLGFLRSKSSFFRYFLIRLLKFYPIYGSRILVVQNSDDFEFMSQVFRSRKNFNVEIIAGSGCIPVENSLVKRRIPKVTIGYVGRIRRDKGILDLLRAVGQLKMDGCDIDLKIWGKLDDPGRHGFKEFELKELNRNSQYFQGFSKDKREMFCSFNWFCLPSNGEGLSKAAIEASSFGLPLLLSNVPGNRDMIKGNGFLFEYGDVEHLKKVLIRVLNLSEHEVQNMSESSRSMFDANWTLESVYNQWKQLLIKYDTSSSKRTKP